MQKAHVHIGGTYSAKVSGKLTTIRIDAEKPNGGGQPQIWRPAKRSRSRALDDCVDPPALMEP